VAGDLDYIVVSKGLSKNVVKRSGFVKELDLQRLVNESSELLSPLGDDLRFLPIGWEVPLGTGRLDLLFVDSNGVLTLIETKLKANDEARREVIGQALEYAMNASNWTLADVLATAKSFLLSKDAPEDLWGKSLEEACASRFGWLEDNEDERAAKYELILKQIESSLGEGKLRIVFGVDEQIESLDRLVRYLSKHSDLQIVLLQVNRFLVDADTQVLIPTLQGDLTKGPGRVPSQTARLTLTEIIESFAEGIERDAVKSVIDLARAAGASFEPGPSGTSIRVRSPRKSQPITIAWIFAPGKPTWLKTQQITFGHGLDYDSTDPEIRSIVDDYVAAFETDPETGDASSKGVRARWMTPAHAFRQLPEIQNRLSGVARALSALSAN